MVVSRPGQPPWPSPHTKLVGSSCSGAVARVLFPRCGTRAGRSRVLAQRMGPRMQARWILRTALLAASLTACAHGAAGALGHDAPLPAGEPRAELSLELDLEQREGCEEAFDLELYKDPGVDLIAWQKPYGECRGRVVSIRYLPRRLSRNALVARVKTLSKRVDVK